MNPLKVRVLLVLAIILMWLATGIHAEPVGQITINWLSYAIVPQGEVQRPSATFRISGQTFALSPVVPPPVVIAPPPVSAIPSLTVPPVGPVLTGPTTRPIPATRPSPATTGVPESIALTPIAKLAIKPGGVYENLALVSTQTIALAAGQTVTFRHCRLDGDGCPFGFRCDKNLGTLVIDHCEILNVASAAVYGSNFSAIGNYVHRSGGDGFKPFNNAVIQGNYVCELGWDVPTAHADGVQIRGGKNIRIAGNFFDLPIDVEGTHSNAALFLQLAAQDVTFDGNFCYGGNFAIHAYADNGGGPSVRITRNTFYTDSVRYGFGSVAKDIVWTDNVDETGKTARPADR